MLVLVDAPDDIFPCPHCPPAELAYEIKETEFDLRELPDVYFLDFGTVALPTMFDIAKRLGGTSVPAPTLYQNGTLYVGEKGLTDYRGIFR